MTEKRSKNPLVVYKHKAKVSEDGKHVFILEPALVNMELSRMKGKDIWIGYAENDVDATPSQHAYYRGYMLKHALQHETFGGYTKDELHQEVLRYADIKSTSGLKVKEYTSFVNKAKDFFAEHDIFFESEDKFAEL